jgi:nucleoside-diphosphate-sugar epimerase
MTPIVVMTGADNSCIVIDVINCHQRKGKHVRVFVTGATGFIGNAVVGELLEAGHEVEGLARSEASATGLAERGVAVRQGTLDDLDVIHEGATAADGVIHLANKHDWANPDISNRAERAAIETISDALVGSDRPFVFASGTGLFQLDRPATEADRSPAVGPDSARGGAENLALEYADRGVRVVGARFAPTVHGAGDLGFIAIVADAARRRGAAPYVGEGTNRWPAAHRGDVARMVRLGLELAPAGSILHGAAEEGVPVRQIIEALAARLGVPAESVPAEVLAEELPYIGSFLAADIPATSDLTRQLLGWEPTGPTLLEDIAAGHYDR